MLRPEVVDETWGRGLESKGELVYVRTCGVADARSRILTSQTEKASLRGDMLPGQADSTDAGRKKNLCCCRSRDKIVHINATRCMPDLRCNTNYNRFEL